MFRRRRMEKRSETRYEIHNSVSCQEGSAESIRCQGEIVPSFELALTVKMAIAFTLVCILGVGGV